MEGGGKERERERITRLASLRFVVCFLGCRGKESEGTTRGWNLIDYLIDLTSFEGLRFVTLVKLCLFEPNILEELDRRTLYSLRAMACSCVQNAEHRR